MSGAASASSSRPASVAGSKSGTSVSQNSHLMLRKELLRLSKNPVQGFSAGLVDESDILNWDVLIIGPSDSMYEGAFLKARLTFPEEYPLLPPKMKFLSEMWHPNVYPDGNVCISILHAPGDDEYGYEDAGERWLPVHSVETVLISVISLLSQESPDLNSPANVDAAKEVRDNPTAYRKRVRRLVRKSAEDAFE